MLVPGVLLDGVEGSDVETVEAVEPLGTVDRSEEAGCSVLTHLTGSSDLVAANRLVRTQNQFVLRVLRTE